MSVDDNQDNPAQEASPASLTDPGGGYTPESAQEAAWLDSYDPSAFPAFGVTCDIVMLTIRGGALCVLLVQRGDYPYRGRWALPGGFVNIDEDLEMAARRELAEETGLEEPAGHFEQLGTYGTVGRDPRMRVVDVAYLAMLPHLPDATPGSDAAQARWWRVDEVTPGMLAFDHDRILADGLERARAKLEYTSLATAFIDEVFTLRELQAVYEAVWGAQLHVSNFRRKVTKTPGFVIATEESTTRGPSRPARLYRAGGAPILHPPLLRPDPNTADEEADTGPAETAEDDPVHR